MLSRHNDGCGPLTLQEGRCTIYGVTGGLTGESRRRPECRLPSARERTEDHFEEPHRLGCGGGGAVAPGRSVFIVVGTEFRGAGDGRNAHGRDSERC